MNTRRLLVFGVILFFLFLYLPIIKCLDNTDAKAKVCELYGECTTDFYYSASGMIGMWDQWKELCPVTPMTRIGVIVLVTLVFAISYILAWGLEYYYEKFRNR